MVKETDPFASLNKMLEENPEFRSTYESVMSVLGEEATDEEGTEVECVEIDGHDSHISTTEIKKELKKWRFPKRSRIQGQKANTNPPKY